MARYDSLTGLPNRAYFYEIVGEALAGGDRDRLCGIAVLDLDDFKSVNDTLGHPIGDGLIYAVGERLAAFASDTIKVSRFGGDEFMIFFDQLEDESHLAALLDSDIRRAAGRRRRRRPRAAHPGQRRRGAVARQGHRCRRDDRQGRPGALQGQGTRQERLAAVRIGDGRGVPQPAADEGRSAQPPSRRGGCASSTSRSSPWTRCASPPARRSAAGTTPISGRSRRPSSFRWPKRWASSPRSAPSCSRRPASNASSGPNEISVSVNLSARDFRNREVVDKVREALDRLGPVAAPARDRGDRDGAARRQVADAAAISRRSRRSACASRSTISAPAIRA